MNPFCEEALRLREAGAAAEVVAVSVDPAQCADTRAVRVDADQDPEGPRPGGAARALDPWQAGDEMGFMFQFFLKLITKFQPFYEIL